MTLRHLILGGHALLGLAAALAIWSQCAGLAGEGGATGREVEKVAPFALRLVDCPQSRAAHLVAQVRN